ncbi:hypothetical protein [Streptomyces sp. NPDC093099]|uniref:hypothetical protein n=1 Tax=Streptomyces sp. NPDC093099 TaxID=3366028 RepID=UPI0038228FD0
MQGDDARDVVPLLLAGHRHRRGDRAQLAAEPLEFILLGSQCGQQELVLFFELVELSVGAGEFAPEPLVALPQPGDVRFARIGLPACGPGGGPPLLELVLEVAPGSVEGCAGDACFPDERLDVAGAAGRDLPCQEPVDRRADAPLDLFALLVAECYVILPFQRPCRSLRGLAWSARVRPEAGSSHRSQCTGWRGDRVVVRRGLPDGPVEEMVGGLRTAGAVTHSRQRSRC